MYCASTVEMFTVLTFVLFASTEARNIPPWNKAVTKRLSRLENQFNTESTNIWEELYSISSKLNALVGLQNSSSEPTENHVYSPVNPTSTENLKDGEEIGTENSRDATLARAFQNEKEHVRNALDALEKQIHVQREGFRETMDTLEEQISQKITEVNANILRELGDGNNETMDMKKSVEKFESIVSSLQGELINIKQKMSTFKIKCGTWESFEDSCYLISENTTTWKDAKEKCEEMGAYLAEVGSKEEAAFLLTLAQKTRRSFGPWLGGTDASSEGDWVWVHSGKRIDGGFVDWHSNEPNGGTRENCLHMYNSKIHFYKWNDSRCSNQTNFICEK